MVFVIKVNPLNNKMEWVVQDEDYDLRNEIARSNYAGMLHDAERNRKYNDAIKAAIRKKCESGSKAVVLDIGTGTGLLAMLAAKAGANQVVACESFRPMADTAISVIKDNSLHEKIKVVSKSSYDLNIFKDTSLTEKPNILVTEIFDTELIGEGVLPTLRHAHENLLNRDCDTVPVAGEIVIQLISSNQLWQCHKLDAPAARVTFPSSSSRCPGTAASYDVHIDKVGDLQCLSEPLIITRFDFRKPYYHHVEGGVLYSKIARNTHIVKGGGIHAVLLWWKLQLDEEGKYVLNMKPKFMADADEAVYWRDHWMQAVYYLPEAVHVLTGDEVLVKCYYDDYCFWFEVISSQSADAAKSLIERPICNCGLHIAWSRERFLMQNDTNLWNVYKHMFDKVALTARNVLCIGEVSLFPFFLVSSAVDKVVYLECFPGSSAGNFIKNVVTMNGLNDKIKVIKSSGLPDAAKVTEICRSKEIEAIVGEPFFSSSLLPWHNFSLLLLFWSLQKANDLRSVSLFLPQKAVLRGVAVEFTNLWQVIAPIKEAEGCTLTAFDRLIQDALAPTQTNQLGPLRDAEPYPLWEYELTLLSESFTLMEFNISTPIDNEKLQQGMFSLVRNGDLHAVVVWAEFWLNDTLMWTTGMQDAEHGQGTWVRYSKQGVCFLPPVCPVAKDDTWQYSAYFNRPNAEMLFGFSNVNVGVQ